MVYLSPPLSTISWFGHTSQLQNHQQPIITPTYTTNLTVASLHAANDHVLKNVMKIISLIINLNFNTQHHAEKGDKTGNYENTGQFCSGNTMKTHNVRTLFEEPKAEYKRTIIQYYSIPMLIMFKNTKLKVEQNCAISSPSVGNAKNGP